MSWEDQFSEGLLKEGYYLYKSGKIRSRIKRGTEYTVNISDCMQYKVVVDTRGDQYEAQCNCWDYRTSHQCRHVVAAFYAIEGKTEEISFAGNKRIQPFQSNESSTDEYHYYDMGKISRNVRITSYRYEVAQGLLDKGIAGDRKIMTFPYRDGEGRLQNGLSCRLSFYRNQFKEEQTAEVIVGRDFLWRGSCDVRRCYCGYEYAAQGSVPGGTELCEHLLAAMIALNQHIIEENPGDATDEKGARFLGKFRRRTNTSSEKAANVFLEPELWNEDGELKAGFRIGIEKGYKVRNLTELVSTVDSNETLRLGKNSAINFCLSEFDERSKPFYEFIRKQVKDNLRRNERIEARRSWGYYDRYETERISSAIPLEGSAMDDFYQLVCELPEISYVRKTYRTGTEKGRLRCTQGKPKLRIRLKELREGETIAGITISGQLPELTQGAKGIYYVDDKFLYKSSQEEYEQLTPLIECADRNGNFTCNVGRRNLAEFYRTVYPVLEQLAVLEDQATAHVERLIPPAPEVIFYLDSVDKILSCKAQISYGENHHCPMEAKQRRQFSQIYRDYAKEREICEVVEEFFPIYEEMAGESLCEDGEGCYRVYREGVDELLKLGEIQCTDRFQNRRVRKSFGIKIGVSVESDLLQLDISSGDIDREELLAIFESYRLKKKYHILRNGDFVDLSSPDMELLNQIFSVCRMDLKNLLGEKIQVPMYRALYLDRLLEDHEELYSHRDRNFRRLVKDFGTVKDSDLEPPKSLEGVLRHYQVYGHKWLRTVLQNDFGGILADEMGLGKTLQMISVLLAEKTEEVKPALIICPASLVYNWKEEFARFAPELKVEAVAGGIKERHEQIRGYASTDVLITSYDLLKRDIGEYQGTAFEYQILDEAQYIKNPRTVAAKTVKVIQAKHKFALTGTPIENRLSELWSIFDFLMPGFLHDYETFRNELEIPITRDKDTGCSEKLKRMIAPFVLRRLKKDVLRDLPDKIEEIRYGVMEQAQQKLYDSQVLRITSKVDGESEEEFRKNKLQILAEITRTRMLCCDPSLVVEGYTGGSAKREACIELIQSAIEGEHRILLFSQFTTMLDLFGKDLEQKEIPYYRLTGETPKEERIRLMKAFNEGDVPVFLISLKAGGTGLNLTGADVVIHYDPWWNLAVQNQATDRAHRIGQTQKVTVYKLIIKGSIEEKIVKLQESKKDLADEVLNGENGTLTSMSREDLLELLS